MTPEDITTIRTRLLLSRREFGLALGFSPNTAERTIRGFEEGTHEITGTAKAAVRYLDTITRLLSDWETIPFFDHEAAFERLRESLPDFMGGKRATRLGG